MLDVSRETMGRLEAYVALLEKWNPRINLVAKSTISEAWTRHIVDSAQVFKLAPAGARHWVDLGSGGGFPGLVVAIMAIEGATDFQMTLVESDTRKATFLRQVIRETGAAAQVKTTRIEQLTPLNADVLSARALADLGVLCGFAERHLAADGVALFQKGATWEKELAEAQKTWRFDCQVINSETDPAAVILKLKGISRV